MSSLSIRGLEPADLSALKQLAAQENGSINMLVLRLINQGLGKTQLKPAQRRYDDLDALAGSWGADETDEFASAAAGFDAVDLALWK